MYLLKSVATILAINAISLATAQLFAVTGATSGINPFTGEVPLRRNINDLYNDPDRRQWSLYIRALLDMQAAPSSDPLSWFQIMGIHGLPSVQWMNGGVSPAPAAAGYCPHGDHLFLPWHRAYVGLYEQALVENAIRIANQYPVNERDQWRSAAERLRSPYWDWAADYNVPPCTTPPFVQIVVPTNDGSSTQTVWTPSPLYSFTLPRNDPSYDSFQYKQTSRCGGNPALANADLSGANLRGQVYNSFSRGRTFDDIGSMMTSGASFEAPHNAVHNLGGCSGGFASVVESAMDPLFMLHHTNVDRLWGLWEAIHPDQKLFNRQFEARGSYAMLPGTTVTPQTPLRPFWGGNGTFGSFHVSLDTVELRDWGYSYESLEYWRKSPSQLTADATSLVNQLYGPGPLSGRRSRQLNEGGSRTEYYLKLSIDVANVPRPCSINAYVAGRLAGVTAILGHPSSGITYAELPLDTAIDASMIRETADGLPLVHLLEKNLQIQFVRPDGEIVDSDLVAGYFDVDVEYVTVHDTPRIDTLPTYSLGVSQRLHPRPCKLFPAGSYIPGYANVSGVRWIS